jgi:cysteinyl-tRNA synthetase
MKHTLSLSNTLTRKKELFISLTPDKVQLYVCGITPYSYSHIGHGRTYINFDLLFRLLQSLGYQVTYARNVTDIDDKLLNKATAEGDENQYQSIAQRYTDDFQHQMNLLACKTPNIEPKATESIEAIITLIQKLMDNGVAYQSGFDIFFDISKASDYGKLSGKKQADLLSGIRVEINEAKKNPGDFVLWKGNNENRFWNSPWGFGRPGWHIECSAMIYQHLHMPIDIHAGGIDLIFPHHENEIAQSEQACQTPLARYWLHNEFININKEKMSKSLGNTITLRELTEKYNPAAFRLYILQHHYKTPIDFSYEGITAAEQALNRLAQILFDKEFIFTHPLNLDCLQPLSTDIIAALCDDLNSPQALALIFEHHAKIKNDLLLKKEIAQIVYDILGLSLASTIKEVIITPEIEALLNARTEARKNKEWQKADEIRNKLKELGYEVQDKKSN